jgi:hypothetical protein
MAVAAAQLHALGVAILTRLESRLRRVRVQRDRGPSPPLERMERMLR